MDKIYIPTLEKEPKNNDIFLSYSQLTPLTYDLRYPDSSNRVFYKDLENFTDYFNPILQEKTGWIAGKYMKFIKNNKIEELRSFDEYMLETLIAGVFWNNYSSNISSVNYLTLRTSAFLFRIRTYNSFVKKWADKVRGYFLNNMLLSSDKIIEPNYKSFDKLLLWLEASGDFKNEVNRLKNWSGFLKTLPVDEASLAINSFINISKKFNERAKFFLGIYTQNIDKYLKFNSSIKTSGREDQILCNRKENDYHLNMFASELLNRQLRFDFLTKNSKIVLLPTCMSQKETKCMSKNNSDHMVCTKCNRKCNVGIITEELEKYNVSTCLIAHTSSFEKLLNKWKGQANVGLVGIACALNLLGGGYEMIRQQIASQCVLLNFSGCKKHWHPEGINTGVDLLQLKRVLNIA